jgi:hypothetical protein
MNFAAAEKIARAVLYEGYILYPYRPSAVKNRQRWSFGTLSPHASGEPSRLVAECLVKTTAETRLDLRVNFLQLVPKATAPEQISEQVREQIPEQRLTDPSLAWDEGIERSSEHDHLRVKDLLHAALLRRIEIGDAGEQRLTGLLAIGVDQIAEDVCRLHVSFENVTPLGANGEAPRAEVLSRAFVSAHVLLGVRGGAFVSLLEPLPELREAAADCHSAGVFPVLVGESPDRSMMLCSPIILYDYPAVAPESEGDFFDGTEMDEMLTLRVLTLTDAEKQELRAGDSHARRILERTEAMSEEAMLRAHGVVRVLRPLGEEAR